MLLFQSALIQIHKLVTELIPYADLNRWQKISPEKYNYGF